MTNNFKSGLNRISQYLQLFEKLAISIAFLTYFAFAIRSALVLFPPRFDEAYTLLMIRGASSIAQLIQAIQHGAGEAPLHTVLVMLLIRLFNGSVNDLVVDRLFSVVLMAISLVVLFDLLRRSFDFTVAVLGTAMFLASSFAAFALLDGRQYVLTLTLGIGAISLFLSGRSSQQWIAAILLFLGLLSHYFTVFVIIALGMSSLTSLFQRWSWRQRLLSIGTEILPLALASLTFLIFWHDQIFNTVSTFSTGQDVISIGYLWPYLIGWPWIPLVGLHGSILITSIGLLGLILWLLYLYQWKFKGVFVKPDKNKLQKRILIVSSFLSISLPLVLWCLGGVLKLNLYDRYFLFQSLGLNITAGIVMGTSLPVLARKFALLRLLVPVLVFLFLVEAYYPLVVGYQSRVAQAQQFLNQTQVIDDLIRKNTPVIFDFSDWDFRFYFQQAWNSDQIAQRATLPVSTNWGWPFLRAYRSYFPLPKIVPFTGKGADYYGSFLISSNPERFWKMQFPDVQFVPVENLGDALGGYQMVIYRLVPQNPAH